MRENRKHGSIGTAGEAARHGQNGRNLMAASGIDQQRRTASGRPHRCWRSWTPVVKRWPGSCAPAMRDRTPPRSHHRVGHGPRTVTDLGRDVPPPRGVCVWRGRDTRPNVRAGSVPCVGTGRSAAPLSSPSCPCARGRRGMIPSTCTPSFRDRATRGIVIADVDGRAVTCIDWTIVGRLVGVSNSGGMAWTASRWGGPFRLRDRAMSPALTRNFDGAPKATPSPARIKGSPASWWLRQGSR